jgi:hypothetical protein
VPEAHDWFIDQAPGAGSEFPAGPGSPAYGKVDLLTAAAHEMGYVLGYEDSGTDGLMAEYLGTGTRRLPTTVENGTQIGESPPIPSAGIKSHLSSLNPHLRALIKDDNIPSST